VNGFPFVFPGYGIKPAPDPRDETAESRIECAGKLDDRAELRVNPVLFDSGKEFHLESGQVGKRLERKPLFHPQVAHPFADFLFLLPSSIGRFRRLGLRKNRR
jgi:hypothetical protein